MPSIVSTIHVSISAVWTILRTIWAFRLVTFSRQHELAKALGRIHGERIRLQLGRQAMVILADPDAIGEMFELDGDALSSGAARRPFFENLFPDGSIFTATGKRRQQLRKAIGRAFSVANSNCDLQATMREQIREWKEYGVCPTQEEIDYFVIRLIGHLVFGNINDATVRLGLKALQQFRELSGLAMSSPLLRQLPPWRGSVQRYKGTQAELLAIIESLCLDDSVDESTFCGHLLAERSRFDLQLEDVKGNTALAFLFAARSTAGVLANMLHYLADNPQWQHVVRNEKETVSGTRQRLLRAVVSESLRLNPVVPFIVRIAERDCEVAGIKVRKGDQVMATALLTHYREESFPNARDFVPNRFLKNNISSHAFIPFGGGKTHCIGSGLVYAIATGFLSLVSEEYQCERVSGSPEDDKFAFQGVLCARSSSHFRLVPRTDSNRCLALDRSLLPFDRMESVSA